MLDNPPIAVTPGAFRLARQARASGITWQFHQPIPLGTAEGRAVAERCFGEATVAGLPKDRYGNPAGWLHTWSTVTSLPRRRSILNWAMLAPGLHSRLEDAFVADDWRGQRAVELLQRGTDLLPRDIAEDWQASLAAEFGLPDIDQRWFA